METINMVSTPQHAKHLTLNDVQSPDNQVTEPETEQDFEQRQALETKLRQEVELLEDLNTAIAFFNQEARKLQTENSKLEEKQFNTKLTLAKLRGQKSVLAERLAHLQENSQNLQQTLQAMEDSWIDNGPIWSRCKDLDLRKNAWLSHSLKNNIKLSNYGEEASVCMNEQHPKSIAPALQTPQYIVDYQTQFQDSLDRSFQSEVMTAIACDKVLPKSYLRNLLQKRPFIPQTIRMSCWDALIENKLGITQKLFQGLLERASKEPKLSIITVDLKRLDLRLSDTNSSKEILSDIQDCLYGFTQLRPDVGYVQGMPYFVWMLLIRMPKYAAFKCFSNLIVCDRLASTLFSFDEAKLRQIMDFFENNLKERRPKVYKHFKKHNITPDLFLVEWGYTFYCRAFKLSLCSKIWDMWLAQGWPVFFKAALAVFEYIQNDLLQKEYDTSLMMIKEVTHQINEKEFLKILKKQKLLKWDVFLSSA